MIARLVGGLVHHQGGRAVIDVGGVGYEVFATSRSLTSWAGSDTVEVHVSTQVREDAITLYGFESTRDREVFLALLGVSGVGPKVALSALDALPTDALHRAVEGDDVATLSQIPGVGKKTAQRLALELKGKLPGDFTAPVGARAAGAPPRSPAPGAGPARLRQVGDRSGPDRPRSRRHRRRRPPRAAPRRRPAGPGGSFVTGPSDRLVDPEGDVPDPALRPRNLGEYVGQRQIRENLRIYIRAALQRGEALDHVLLAGPPGLGKTSMAYILAEELGVELRTASGPTLERKGDLAAILNSLQTREVLFIDEIHRLQRAVEEVLYPAMEDFEIDVVLGQGPGANSIKLPLPRFTLVGATTRSGMLSAPLRARFGIHATFEFYTAEELEQIIARSAHRLGVVLTPEGCREMARRSRGTPRIANRLLRRVRDFAEVEGDGTVDATVARGALERLGIDADGLDTMDRKILHTIAVKFSGGPVGLDTLSHAIGETSNTIEDTYEPFLILQGFLNRTPRGRVVTPRGRAQIGLPPDDPRRGTLL